MSDTKEYARQMRENCVKNEAGNIVCSPELWEQIASIIERAIVPPCKVGDKIYYIPFGNHIIECIVAQIAIEPFAEIGMSFLCYGGVCFDMRHWGKTVFLTREEAERALEDVKGV